MQEGWPRWQEAGGWEEHRLADKWGHRGEAQGVEAAASVPRDPRPTSCWDLCSRVKSFHHLCLNKANAQDITRCPQALGPGSISF